MIRLLKAITAGVKLNKNEVVLPLHQFPGRTLAMSITTKQF
jgi:hypothetical protein